jgi:hypothetical protein
MKTRSTNHNGNLSQSYRLAWPVCFLGDLLPSFRRLAFAAEDPAHTVGYDSSALRDQHSMRQQMRGWRLDLTGWNRTEPLEQVMGVF